MKLYGNGGSFKVFMVSLNGFKDKAPQTDGDAAEEGFEGLSEQSKVKNSRIHPLTNSRRRLIL